MELRAYFPLNWLGVVKGKSTSESSGKAAKGALCQIYYPIIRNMSMKNDEIVKSNVFPPRAGLRGGGELRVNDPSAKPAAPISPRA